MWINQQICFWEIVGIVAGIAASVASTGYSIASAAGAFDKKEEDMMLPPETMQTETEAELRAKKLRKARMGQGTTYLTRGQQLGSPNLAKAGLKQRLGA